MNFEKYGIERDNIKNILGYIESGQIAIPELQRPFVWKPKQITELIESLYNGLPISSNISLISDCFQIFPSYDFIDKLIKDSEKNFEENYFIEKVNTYQKYPSN